MNKKTKNIILFSLLLIVIIVVTIIAWPYVQKLTIEENRIKFKNYLDSLGILGWFIMVGIQVLQIIIAFIPGEPIEILMGVMYGPWLGLLTSLVGILIGTVIVYSLAKLIGKPFINLFVKEEDLKKFKFLKNQRNIELTTFILFFIPGTPKDVLTYIVPLTPIKAHRFFLIATFARIPSIITSTLIGDSLIGGNIVLTIIIFVITALISILGIVINNKFISKRQNDDENVVEEKIM